MKFVAIILSFLTLGLGSRDLLHHFAHEHEVEHSSLLHCSCCADHSETNSTSLSCAEHTDCGPSSCHSEDEQESNNCGCEGQQCGGNCHCIFSVSTPYKIQEQEEVSIVEFKVEHSFYYTEVYHFELYSPIWHPPKKA